LYKAPLVPSSFEAPTLFEGDRYVLRPLNHEVLLQDYEAVMKGASNLTNADRDDEYDYSKFTLQDEVIELGWHTGEWRRRHSFAYSIMSPDSKTCYGSVYINPTMKRDYDAQIILWTVPGSPQGLEATVYDALRAWITAVWPFKKAGYPGKEMTFAEWDALVEQ